MIRSLSAPRGVTKSLLSRVSSPLRQRLRQTPNCSSVPGCSSTVSGIRFHDNNSNHILGRWSHSAGSQGATTLEMVRCHSTMPNDDDLSYSDEDDKQDYIETKITSKNKDKRLYNNSRNTLHANSIPTANEEDKISDETIASLKSSVQDLTFARNKAGTPSPWALFDAWGAGADIVDPLSPSEEEKLREESVAIPMTDGERVGMPDETEILDVYDRLLQQKSSSHFGYPYNLMYDHSEIHSFMRYSINNLGDPWVSSNYGVHSRQFECSVIDFFARLWKMKPDSYWGYVTTSGTEGNLHGILLARERLPDGILYTSNETHYSVFKAARYYRMDCNSIPTCALGEINYAKLAEEINKNRDRPVILNVNIGTTVKGAVDNLDRILDILQTLGIPREQYHIHCDGALFALMMPFIENAPEISFRKPIDSIAVSGHKMLGCPMPCGIALTRKEHVKNVEERIDYLNSVDTTIMGSRNGQTALYLWYSLRKKGIAGIKRDVMHCMETARYLRDKLAEAGFSCGLNTLSSTVVLERPMDDHFIKRWQLACEEDIAHVVVMPNVTRSKIDLFVAELIDCSERHGRTIPTRSDSPLSKLSSPAWDVDYSYSI